MFNINALFYKEEVDFKPVVKLKRYSSTESAVLSGRFIKKVILDEEGIGLNCTGNFVLSLIKTEDGSLVFKKDSENQKFTLKNQDYNFILNDEDKYIFILFACKEDIEIIVDDLEHCDSFELIKSSHTLHSYALPTINFSYYSYDLFYKGQLYFENEVISGNKTNHLYIAEKPVDFCTYFNAIETSKWKKITCIEGLYAHFDFKGYAVVRVKCIEPEGVFTIKVVKVKAKELEKVKIPIPLKYEVIGIEIHPLFPSEIFNLQGKAKLNNNSVKNKKLAIIITAFNEPNVLNNILDICENLNNYTDINYHFYIVDNSKTLDSNLSSDRISIIPNRNLGGTGGFVRGFCEALRNNFEICMFMDDDALTHPVSIEKAYSFLLLNNDKTCAVSGAMFDKDNMYDQTEAGAYFNEGCHPLHTHLDGRDPLTLIKNQHVEKEVNMYGSWWFFMFNVDEKLKLPMPFFVRGDDIDFSYKNNFRIELLSGCASWQENFVKKENVSTVFLFIRSHIIHHITIDKLYSNDKEALKSINKIIKGHVFLYLKQYKYDLALSVIESLKFVLKGEENWVNTCEMRKVLSLNKEKTEQLSTEKKYKVKNLSSEIYKDFYTRLKLWPITRIMKLFTMNSILIPRAFKSNKIWVLPKNHFVDPKYLFLKNRYIQQKNSNEWYLTSYSLYRTIRILFLLMVNIAKLNNRFHKIQKEYAKLDEKYQSVSGWNELF